MQSGYICIEFCGQTALLDRALSTHLHVTANSLRTGKEGSIGSPMLRAHEPRSRAMEGESMSRLRIVLITVVIAFPLGIFARDVVLNGHPNLQKAYHSLNEAYDWINKSQTANERVWRDEGSHGQRAKEYIERAKRELDLAAEWINSHERK